jgi:hypothetical protein
VARRIVLAFGTVCHFAGTFHESALSADAAGAGSMVVAALDSTGGCPGGRAVDVEVVVVIGGSFAIAPVGPAEPEPPSCIERPAANAAAEAMAATIMTVEALKRLASFFDSLIGDG